MTIIKGKDSAAHSRLISSQARLYIPPEIEIKIRAEGKINLDYYYFGNAFMNEIWYIGQNVSEPRFVKEESETVNHIRLEDLAVGDILKVSCHHPSAVYIIERINRDHPYRKLRIWNGRGPFCFESNLELISYFDPKNNEIEMGALKVETRTDWPYFVVDQLGLRAPQQTWVDSPQEILLQHKQKR